MKKNIIKAIELEINGTSIKMTPEQAKLLFDELGEFFQPKEVIKYVPYQPFITYPPTYLDPLPQQPWRPTIICQPNTCDAIPVSEGSNGIASYKVDGLKVNYLYSTTENSTIL